ncbi:PEP-CTERM sorting domain-containing protein [Psychrosphaera sp. 1_MG-2023]|uniref:PEP-CTERM sorting domain-containing protein n=1 Tax=Psychrosphaera sp. 1_MG-2023 TaxID=3062643 RepID=UPI0026E28139|nr:PEP-CTERM sorting domain-containing protein [Psychrosphaera sp. 1_MG-2023]MDO6717961.1 PEP-CTERM sorting domain-containing protein [Psychrosphaera sp. 1_MG-2023]
MKKVTALALIFAGLILSATAQATVISLDAYLGSDWKATVTPESFDNTCYPCASNIFATGLTWESANSGWNISASYDDSSWSAYSGGLPAGALTPFYARQVFNIDGTPNYGTFSIGVDDDSLVWVNGILVPGLIDNNGGNSGVQTADITSYLVSGDNVIAFKAHNSAGGGFGVYGLTGSVTYEANAVPEPTTLMLLSLSIAGIVFNRRKKV